MIKIKADMLTITMQISMIFQVPQKPFLKKIFDLIFINT